MPVSAAKGAGSCGADGVVAYVVAIGKRARWVAETRSGWASPVAVAAGGAAECDTSGRAGGSGSPIALCDAAALGGAVVRGEAVVPQPAASAAMASAMTGMAAFAFPAVGRFPIVGQGQLNRK